MHDLARNSPAAADGLVRIEIAMLTPEPANHAGERELQSATR
jgi:hypothetical protein